MMFEILISTMNQKNVNDCNKLISKMNVQNNNTLIINQITNETPLFNVENNKNRVLSYKEKGLSRSRNRALYMGKGDICLISDENMKYINNLENTILDCYKKHPDFDIIIFYVENAKPINCLKEGNVGLLKSLKICSVQITYNRKKIMSKGIMFDEKFGTGSGIYNSGEENIFLSDCLKNGLKIYYCPIKIGILQKHNSTWFKGYNNDYFITKGACYGRIFGKYSFLINIQFLIRKNKIYRKEISTLSAINNMRKGRKKLKKNTYFIGDMINNTGPSIVNKSYYSYLKYHMYFCFSNNRLLRFIHFLFYVLFIKNVFVSGFSKLNILMIKLSKRLNKKTYYLMHGFIKEESKYMINCDKNDIYIEYDLLKVVDYIICVSENFSNLLKETYPEFSSKIHFLNNGVDTKIQKNKVPHNNFTIISVGGGMRRKNNLAICDAIKNINKNIRFIVIGSSLEDGGLIKKYPFVEFYEYLSHEDVLNKMCESDLYIQNSYFETFGLSVMEALDCGCNLLLSKNIGAISILQNITENDIIYDNECIDEISKKILSKLKEKNVKITYDQYTSSCGYQCEKLTNLIDNFN